MERKGKVPVTMLTAYDYNTAHTIDEAGIDMVLVGDSLGNVMLGYENTLGRLWSSTCPSCRTRHRWRTPFATPDVS